MKKIDKKREFLSPTKGWLSLAEVAQEIFLFIDKFKDDKFNIIIGTDSQKKENSCDFVTVIVVHWVGHFARYFYKRLHLKKVKSLRERIYNEVVLSLEISQRLLKFLKVKFGEKKGELQKYDLGIHVDIGGKGPTKSMIKEITGMIEANGFKVKIKPDAFAASTVADRHV